MFSSSSSCHGSPPLPLSPPSSPGTRFPLRNVRLARLCPECLAQVGGRRCQGGHLDGVAAIGPCLAAWSVVRLSVVRPLCISFFVLGLLSISFVFVGTFLLFPVRPSVSVWLVGGRRRHGGLEGVAAISRCRHDGVEAATRFPRAERAVFAAPFGLRCPCLPSRRHWYGRSYWSRLASSRLMAVVGVGGEAATWFPRAKRAVTTASRFARGVCVAPPAGMSGLVMLFRLAASSSSVAVVGVGVGLD